MRPRKMKMKMVTVTSVLAAFLAACGTGTTDVTDAAATGTEQTSEAEQAEISEALDEVVAACGDRDRDRLQDRLADDLHDQVRDRDRDRLFAAEGTTIELLSRTVEIDGDTATVTTVIAVTRDDETSEVERTWVFERTEDGTWVLTEVPDCLFER